MGLKVFLAVLQLALTFWVAWAKADSDKKKDVEDLKKEADEAVDSGDICRVHRLIERIGRL